MDFASIKHGPCFWPDWHTKKVEQVNARHGAQPRKSVKDISLPPPPKPCVRPKLQLIQKTVERVTSKLEQQLQGNTKGKAFVHCTIAVCHLKTDEDHQVITVDQFDGQSGSGSVYALGSDTSSELVCDNLNCTIFL